MCHEGHVRRSVLSLIRGVRSYVYSARGLLTALQAVLCSDSAEMVDGSSRLQNPS